MGVDTIHEDGAPLGTSGTGLGERGESPLEPLLLTLWRISSGYFSSISRQGVPPPVRSRRYADVPVEVKKRCLETLLSISLQKLLAEPENCMLKWFRLVM